MINNYVIMKEDLSSGEERFLICLDMGRLTPFITLGVQRRYVQLKYFDTEKEAKEHLGLMKKNKVIKQEIVFDTQDSQEGERVKLEGLLILIGVSLFIIGSIGLFSIPLIAALS